MIHPSPTRAAEPRMRPAPVGDHAADVDAARQGDRAAFARLYEAFAPMVHGVLMARVGPAAADDLVQDVFLRAMSRIGDLREASAFGGWIAAIARNEGASHLRSRRPTATLEDDACGAADAGGSVVAQEILGAVASLPEAYRETLLMRLVEGMTGPEIAIRAGMTEGSVRVNLCRGMAMLRERLGAGKDER